MRWASGVGRCGPAWGRCGARQCWDNSVTESWFATLKLELIQRQSWRWLAEEGLTADLDVADMKDLPYRDGFFGAVFSVGVLTHGTLPDIRKALAEMARVLRPGGLFLGTFISTESSLLGKGERIDDRTWICDDESEAGVIHHFMTAENVMEEVAPFLERAKLPAVKHVCHGGEIDTGRPYVSAHWVFLGRRLQPEGT